MELLMVKRRLRINGRDDVSMVAAFAEDDRKMSKLPFNEIIKFNPEQKRKERNNGQIWSLCEFVFETHIKGNEGGCNSKEELYDWLKFEVGFTKLIKIGDTVVKYPRNTNFKDCPDENIYLEQFFLPVRETLARMMGMTVELLIECSLEWRENHK